MRFVFMVVTFTCRLRSLISVRFMVMVMPIAGWGMRFMYFVCVCFMVMIVVVAFHLWGRGVGAMGTMGVFGFCVEGAHRQGEAAEEEGATREG